MLLGFGIGNLTLAERYVPSGIAALIIAALPIWVTIFQRIAGIKTRSITLVGIFIGLIGVAIIVLPGGTGPAPGADPTKVKFWMFMILIGNIAWAFGTFMTQRIPIPKPSNKPPKKNDDINSSFLTFNAFLPLIISKIIARTPKAEMNLKPIESSGGAVSITSAIPK